MKLYLVIVFELAAALLVWSCFCRAAFTHKRNTRRPIRWTFTLLAIMACTCFFAPILWHYEPDGVSAGLAGVLALTQLVTNHYWRQGVPPQFKEPS